MNSKPLPKRARTRRRLEIISQNLDKADAEIGRMMGISSAAVSELRRRYKIAKVAAHTQRTKRLLGQIRKLKPGLPTKAVALKLGISPEMAWYYGKMLGYHFPRISGKHFHWSERFKHLSHGLTLSSVAQELGVSYGHAALLCFRHGYKVRIAGSSQPPRVPIRRWLRRPEYELRLAALKPEKSLLRRTSAKARAIGG
jgi:DNA-binding CsgD family transcriptional regulator